MQDRVRHSNIELLRIMAIIMIVGCHFASHGSFSFDSHSITIPYLWWLMLELGGNLGVDIFVMITGYFLIDRKELSLAPRKIIKLWGSVEFYSVVLFIVSLLWGGISLSSIVKAVLPITYSQYWFASAYFVMYLLHPYMNRLLQSFSRCEYQLYLLLILVLWVLLPTFTLSSFQSNVLIEFLLFYSVAGYMKLYEFHSEISSKRWFGLWFLFSALTVVSTVIIFGGIHSETFGEYKLHFYNRNSILTFLRSVCLFNAFLKLSINNKIVNKISQATFGVYLIHDSNSLRSIIWNDLFHNSSFQNTLLIIPYSITVVLVVFSVCVIIELIRIKFIEKPLLYVLNNPIEKSCLVLSKCSNWLIDKIFGN